MIDIDKLAKELKEHGFTFHVGKPSENNQNIFNHFKTRFALLTSTSTKEAFGIAAGAALGDAKPVVVVDEKSILPALSTLHYESVPFNLPHLGIIVSENRENSLPHPIEDAMLLAGLKLQKLDVNKPLEEQVKEAKEYIQKTEKPLFWIISKKDLPEMPISIGVEQTSKLPFIIQKNKGKESCSHRSAIRFFLKQVSRETKIFTADPITAEVLEDEGDHIKHLHLNSTDSDALAVAFGYSLQTKHPVVCIDTPTTMLSNLCCMASVGFYRPPNLLHIVIDDNTSASTGGQKTISNAGNYAQTAHSLGYDISFSMDCKEELSKHYMRWKADLELTFIHLKTDPEKEARPAKLFDDPPLKRKEKFLAK